jgi:DNA-directed RNA polymerase beta' subunit
MLLKGTFDKGAMLKIFDVIYHIYPSSVSEMTVNNLQILGNHWLKLRGYSIGLEDCLTENAELSASIQRHIDKCFYEAEIIASTTINERIREVKVQEVLNKAQAVGMRITKEGFVPTNNFLGLIKSGSKGDYFNVAQICGLLGQQYIKGARIKPDLNNGTRTLVHYPFTPPATELRSMTYTSRGFICSSFFKGLSPTDIFFHGEAGRAGVVDTALGTATTGYMSRRVVKLVEDLKVCYDGTVRNEMNQILQFRYGNGFEITKSPDPTYIGNLAAALNNDYEALK